MILTVLHAVDDSFELKLLLSFSEQIFVLFIGTTTIEAGDIDVSPGEVIDGRYVLKMGTAHKDDAYAKACAQSSKTAYSQASSQKCTNQIASDLAGLTLTPGVYCTPTEKFVVSASTVTFDARNNPAAQWIFQTAESVNTAGYTTMKLVNGAKANNIFWAVGSAANLGAYSSFVGNILAQSTINIGTSSTMVGRALAQLVVTFADDGKANQNSIQSIGLPTSGSALKAGKRIGDSFVLMQNLFIYCNL